MPKYQSEFPQYVVPSPEEDNPIEVDVIYTTRLAELQKENERLRKNLKIFSHRAYKLQIENAKLLEQNRRLKSSWLTGICVTVGAFFCLALIVHAWS